MPPKKTGGNQPSKKTIEKAKARVMEDKTFGLKNKNKSKKVEKYIKGVASQVKGKDKKNENDAYLQKQQKKAEEERKKVELALFKPVIQQKVPPGVDPKSVVCDFFRNGMCTKGDKCKFSHNLEQQRKSEKIDLYTDRRELSEEEQAKMDDTMDKWDQKKLEEVVSQKQNMNTKTQIVCKYFLEAVEDHKYGWFWDCPNGGEKCQYQHCLPPGYVLKPKNKKEEIPEDEKIPLEEILEEERSKLTTRTPLTLELFLKWKQEKKKQKEKKLEEDRAKREEDVKSGKTMRSGREMFIFNPDLFVDEDGVIDVEELDPNDNKDEGPVINIEVSETSITTRITNADEENHSGKEEMSDGENGEEDGENGQHSGSDQEENGVEVKEELFREDEIPDEEDEKEDQEEEN